MKPMNATSSVPNVPEVGKQNEKSDTGTTGINETTHRNYSYMNANKPQNKENKDTEPMISIEIFEQISQSKTILAKIFWIFILLICCVGLGYGIYMESMDYLSNLKATRLNVRSFDKMRLPDISVCHSFPLNVKKLLDDGYDQKEIAVMHLHLQENPYKQVTGNFMEGLSHRLNASTINPSLYPIFLRWESFIRNYSVTCRELFVQCTVSQVPFDCCDKANQVLHEKLAQCFVFKNIVINSQSIHSGLVILARPPPLVPEMEKIQLLPFERAIVLEIADHYSPPYTYGSNQQFLVSPNTKAYISLKKNVFKRVGNCEYRTTAQGIACCL